MITIRKMQKRLYDGMGIFLLKRGNPMLPRKDARWTISGMDDVA